MSTDVIALPGGVMPAAHRYAPLIAAVGDEARVHPKDLEIYAEERVPANHSIATEVNAVARFADSLDLERFHLAGYSGGGFVALAFAGAHPERLLSLALFEPAGIPGAPTAEETALQEKLASALAGLSGPEFMRVFTQMQVRPGVTLSQHAGPPAPWMRNRPAGIAGLMDAFGRHPFDREQLRACAFPTLYAYGELTSHYEEIKAATLAPLLADLHIRRFPGIHHFVAPEQIFGEAHVQDLIELWRRGQPTGAVGEVAFTSSS